ncbi:MAG: hypothetical protein LBV51_05740 [Acholeplasmatales bacterium]|jgi:hypothetical protein|nr:hypothetical protein [Acholeplasmatales bacterium]
MIFDKELSGMMRKEVFPDTKNLIKSNYSKKNALAWVNKRLSHWFWSLLYTFYWNMYE